MHEIQKGWQSTESLVTWTVNHYKEETLIGLNEIILPNKWIIHEEVNKVSSRSLSYVLHNKKNYESFNFPS